jgi:hypothetical protein
MRATILAAAAACAVLGASGARAYEYTLQFTPAGNYKDLVVAGYQIAGSTVVGNCSYTQITSGSGRDPKTIYTPIPQTCTWDLYGALLGTASGAPVVPAPIGTNGTQTVYAMASPQLYAGSDSAPSPHGFVFTFGSHYTWLTSNAHVVVPQGGFDFSATLASDGDVPLNISAVTVNNQLKPQARATISANTCTGGQPVGGTCTVSVHYTDKLLFSTTGLSYDTITIHLSSDAGQTQDFVLGTTDQVRVPPP